MTKLNDQMVRGAKAAERPYSLADGGGMGLVVQPSGTKSWTLKYRLEGRSLTVGLGHYPAVSLAAARVLAGAARERVAGGAPPVAPSAEASGVTVADMIAAWMADNRERWSDSFRWELTARLRKEVSDKIGDRIAETVTTRFLMDEIFRPLKARSHDMAQRVRQHLDLAFQHGKATGAVTHNPATDIKAVLGPKPADGMYPAIVDIGPARAMLATVEALPGFPACKLLNRFQALTGVRPGEARGTQWGEFEMDGAAPIWRIPEARMKMKGRGDHLVPLSPQAVAVIEAARTLFGRFRFCFPGSGIKPLSENAITAMLRRAGFTNHCAHGWRSTFSTVMNDQNPLNELLIEASLAHYKPDVAGRYNRGTHLDARRALMVQWADLLTEGMVPAAELIIGPRRSSPGASPLDMAA